MAATAKLSSKSQIVIPAEARRKLGLRAGDILRVEIEEDRLVLTRADPLGWLERLKSFGTGRWREAEEEIERSRAEWDEYSEEIDRLRGECAK